MVDNDHWNQKLMGFTAQQAVENALKGWLSTFNDPSRFRHDLNAIWAYLEKIQDWSQPDLDQLHQSLTNLFAHTRYNNPQPPGGQKNWLADYADIYRYDANPRTANPGKMTQPEKRELQQLVNHAIQNLTQRIHQTGGATDTDIFTDGKRPWET